MLAFVTWTTVDHLSVLIAAVAASVAVYYARQTVSEARRATQEAKEAQMRAQLFELIEHAARLRGYANVGDLAGFLGQLAIVRALARALRVEPPSLTAFERDVHVPSMNLPNQAVPMVDLLIQHLQAELGDLAASI